MKKMNKKGFTIVELVIVIAVIAILAAVMIPTFSGIVEKANNSSVLQEARTAFTVYMAEFNYTTGTPATYLVIGVDTDSTPGPDKYVAVIDGEMSSVVYKTSAEAKAPIDAATSKTTTVAPENVALNDTDAYVYVVTVPAD